MYGVFLSLSISISISYFFFNFIKHNQSHRISQPPLSSPLLTPRGPSVLERLDVERRKQEDAVKRRLEEIQRRQEELSRRERDMDDREGKKAEEEVR